uniref:chromosome segregation protein SMC n=1 Tax=Halalkalibacterium ligniniphilum TaxID=1134413 RepID=UPI000373C684
EKRLDETQENLYRVDDILYELEGQVEPLMIQASIAKDYLEKKAELKDVEVSLMVYEIGELHKQWSKEKEDLEALRNDHANKTKDVKRHEESIQSLREQLKDIDEDIRHLQETLLSASEELEKNEGRREVLKERKKNFTQNREQLMRAIEEARRRKNELAEELEQEEQAGILAKNQVKELQTSIKEKEALLAAGEIDLEKELDRLKSDYIEVLNEQASLRNEKRYIDEQLRLQGAKHERLLHENEHLIEARAELEERQANQQQLVKECETELDEAIKAYRSEQARAEQLRRDYEKNESKLYEAYQLSQRIQSRKDVLEELQADFSGFFQGVKEILKARDTRLTGIIGAVAELLSVPKAYETAIEIALGGATQHIVVESEADGRKAIQFLKQQRFGRATFLPLPVIKGRFIPEHQLHQAKQHDSFIGVAASLVDYEERFHQVIGSMLGHVIIAKDLQGANDIARMLGHRYRVVTLDGDVVSPGGSMTGGSVKQKQTPLLGRQRELEELTEKLAQMEVATGKLEKVVKERKEQLVQIEARLEQLREHGENARTKLQAAKEKLQETAFEAKAMGERLALVDREQASYDTDQENANRRLTELDERLTAAIQQGKDLEKAVQELEHKQKTIRSSKEALLQDVTARKIELAKAQERYASVSQRIARLKDEQQKVMNELDELESTHHLLQDEMTASSSGELSLDERIEKSRKQKLEASEKAMEARKRREELAIKLEMQEENLKALQGQLVFLSETCHEKEVKVNRYDVELDNRLSHLREEYELSYEAAKEQYPLKLEVEEAQTKVKLIKLAIAELGTVNLGAIEEYERVNERYQFLKEQQADLVEAKDTLRHVIAEMDEEMTKRFSQSFVEIQKQFRLVFKELFGGGEADLVLTNPGDMLVTGVEIMARPPGKKLQHLALLSGGERALTAIALLFAILRVRPVPFCVLDEVEAALDEANVHRFAHYLKEFSDETQFIVITHRKGTMEEADVLYGVTMQESGVSRLVSVKLEETKELIET